MSLVHIQTSSCSVLSVYSLAVNGLAEDLIAEQQLLVDLKTVQLLSNCDGKRVEAPQKLDISLIINDY